MVIEVRDARCPLATGHPDIGRWMGSSEKKLRIVVLNRMDMVTSQERSHWGKWFKDLTGEDVVRKGPYLRYPRNRTLIRKKRTPPTKAATYGPCTHSNCFLLL